MNAVGYTNHAGRIITFPQTAPIAGKTRLYWISSKVVRRPAALAPVDNRATRSAPKSRIVFTNSKARPESVWRLPLVLSSMHHPWQAKLWSFTQLGPGWNGSRAPAPSLRAIVNSARFIQTMNTAGAVPDRITPSAVGGVAVTRRVEERKVLVEFFNDGTANALFADDAAQEMHTLAVPTTAEGCREGIRKMREYLDG